MRWTSPPSRYSYGHSDGTGDNYITVQNFTYVDVKNLSENEPMNNHTILADFTRRDVSYLMYKLEFQKQMIMKLHQVMIRLALTLAFSKFVFIVKNLVAVGASISIIIPLYYNGSAKALCKH
jgi:hypothetical protein